MDGNVWRIDGLDGFKSYPSCDHIGLGNAIVISNEFHLPVLYADKISFKSFCHTQHPTYMSAKYDGVPAQYFPQLMRDWSLYTSTRGKFGRNFHCSIYSFLMAHSANLVITICSTLLAFIIIRKRPHCIAATLLRLGSLVASVNMISTVSRMFIILKNQHIKQGVIIPEELIDFLQRDATFTILNFISVTLIQFCQVFLVMRTFERNLERRIIFYLSAFLLIATNILWVVPQLGTVAKGRKVSWSTFPTFVYLFRIAVSSSYATVIISFILKQRKLWYRHLQLSFLTFLVILSVLLSPGFFIADIANAWIDLLGEAFTTTCYLAATFMVWEWLERFSLLKTKNESESVLGKQIFLDEERKYNFANYSLSDNNAEQLVRSSEANKSHGLESVESINDEGSENLLKVNIQYSTNEAQQQNEIESISQIEYETKETQRERITHEVATAIKKFLIYADQALFNKLGTPSLMSASNSSVSQDKELIVKRRLGLDKPGHTFVYFSKEITFDSDDECNNYEVNDEEQLSFTESNQG